MYLHEKENHTTLSQFTNYMKIFFLVTTYEFHLSLRYGMTSNNIKIEWNKQLANPVEFLWKFILLLLPPSYLSKNHSLLLRVQTIPLTMEILILYVFSTFPEFGFFNNSLIKTTKILSDRNIKNLQAVTKCSGMLQTISNVDNTCQLVIYETWNNAVIWREGKVINPSNKCNV